jgi:hypothetical protein
VSKTQSTAAALLRRADSSIVFNQHYEADGAIALATKGKGAVKSLPFHVFSRTPALSHRAMMRKPSYLIS